MKKEKNIKIGDRVKVIGNMSGHGIPVGTKGIIRLISGTNAYLEGFSPYFHKNDLKKCPGTLEELKEDNKKLKAEIAENDIKLKFMEENGLDEFNDNHFKAYAILKTLKSKKTDIEMAKAIADIIE